MRYPVVIHKDENSDFGVMVPDIPGCYSAGNTYDEALNNVIEAIECHLEGLLLDNESIPVGSSMDCWINNEEFKEGVWAFVDICPMSLEMHGFRRLDFFDCTSIKSEE